MAERGHLGQKKPVRAERSDYTAVATFALHLNAPTSVTSSSPRPQVQRATLGCLEHPLDQLPKLLGRKGFAEDRHAPGAEEHCQA